MTNDLQTIEQAKQEKELSIRQLEILSKGKVTRNLQRQIETNLKKIQELNQILSFLDLEFILTKKTENEKNDQSQISIETD